MVEPTQQNSQDASKGGSQDSIQASADASLTTQTKPDASTQATAPVRPEGLADQYWDDKAGLKTKELLADFTKFQTDAATRAAAVPESADKYEVALPKDFQLPEGYELDAADPAWKIGREFAHKAGLSQDQFSGLARAYIEADLGRRNAEAQIIEGAVKARDEALGTNGAARVDAVNNWFKATFEDKVADQMSKTLFTPDIVSAFEKIQLALTNQGAQGFRQDGRKEGRSDGKPEGFESWSAIDRRTWDLQQQDAKRQGR